MSESANDYRKYLDPRMLARISSLDLRARLDRRRSDGRHASLAVSGISVEFAQHRPYVQGDDIRHVDWKVLGKTDKIYLKQYLEENQSAPDLHRRRQRINGIWHREGKGATLAKPGEVRTTPPPSPLRSLHGHSHRTPWACHLRSGAQPVFQAE